MRRPTRGTGPSLLSALLVFATSVTTAIGQPSATRPELPRSLRDQAMEALTKGEREKAEGLYERWLEADARDAGSWYNLACLRALGGKSDGALAAFERSVDAGWSDAAHARRDPDLESIRNDPRFSAALERIDAARAAAGPDGYIRRYAPMRSRGSYIVMLPPDYDSQQQSYPICLILHGSGSSDLGHGRLADALGREGVIYVAPRAPYPHTGVVASGTLGWTAWPPDDLPDDDPNLEAIPIDYVDWIFACVDDVRSRYRADSGRIAIYGHSQGGNFALLSTLLHPDRVGRLFWQAGSLPNERYLTAERFAALRNAGLHAHLLHGDNDNVVPVSTSRTIDSLMSLAGVEHTFETLPGTHGINSDMVERARQWIDAEVRRRR